MTIHWGVFWTRTRKHLKTCWLITAGIVTLYVVLIRPQERNPGIASSRATGLASSQAGWEPLGLWRQASMLHSIAPMPMLQKGAMGGVPQSMSLHRARLVADADKSSGNDEASTDRKLVRTATLNFVVKSTTQVSEKIIRLVDNAGGYLVTSQVSGGEDAPYASLVIRVPAAKFEEVRGQIRALGLRIDDESVGAEDVTRQYVDDDARLRNLRAQEQQYLDILRKAATVKDTLDVSEKLNEVRGAIEEKQAEFAALSRQVETVAINITLHTEADAQVFGLHWRPLYQLKIAAREGLTGLGDYVASMTYFIFYLPTLVLWLFTIVAGAAVVWRILRWTGRVFFGRSRIVLRQGGAAQ